MTFFRQFTVLALLVLSGCASTPSDVAADAPIYGVAAEGATPQFPPFDVAVLLEANHPELSEYKPFLEWRQEGQGIGRWFATTYQGTSGEEVRITVPNAEGTDVFAAITTNQDGERKVLDFSRIDLRTLRIQQDDAVNLFRKAYPGTEIQYVLPSVVVEKDELNWRITPVAPIGKIYDVRQSGAIEEIELESETSPPAASVAPKVGSDAIAENELHHFATLASTVEEWIRSAGIDPDDIRGQAKVILTGVRGLLEGNAALTHVYYFTLSDEKILGAQDPKTKKSPAMCDEYAVMTVTALRSVGIRARIKYFRWHDPAGKERSHAAVEFEHEGERIPMDAALNLFDEPRAYRNKYKNEKVRVIDVDFPLDSRSTVGVKVGQVTIQDGEGDGILHPWLDFAATPDVKGEERDCYSREAPGCP